MDVSKLNLDVNLEVGKQVYPAMYDGCAVIVKVCETLVIADIERLKYVDSIALTLGNYENMKI
jgi:hypothetical protein